MPSAPVVAERVLVVAPTSADAAMTRSILETEGVGCTVCADLQAVRAELERGAGALLLTDELLASSDQHSLVEALNVQPAWSDLPVVLLSAEGADSDAAVWAAAALGSVTVLERPVRVATLVSTLRSAIRARRRQYQLRDRIDELSCTEASLRRQTQQLQFLWQAAAKMLEEEDPAAELHALFERFGSGLDLDAYAYYRADRRSGALHLEASAGVPRDAAAAIGRVDAADDPIARLMASEGLHAYALFPLFVAGRLVGFVSFGSRRRKAFDAAETEFLRTIAHYVTTASERARLIRELRDTDRRKDEFLATLAHELRNPLAPIRNALHIMRLSRDATEVERARAMMQRQLGHMVRLIDDLLDVSRITRGKLELRKERVELAAIVRSALETVRPIIDAAGHALVVDLPAQPVYLDADPIRLAQVLSNLLGNAAKYMERGGRIALSAKARDGAVTLVVRDWGIGIPGNALPSIFDMFTQVDHSIGRSQGGLGIGLTLVKSLVEMHGGRVSARSDGIDQGSEFTVHLPAAPGARPEPAEREDDEPAAAAISCRVLVADDNVDAAESLAAILRTMRHDVRTVRDGEAAIEEAEAFRPDVILLDIGMPKVDGYEAARRIRSAAWGKHVFIVALTGWGQDDDKRKAADAGFDRHFTKPFDPTKLGLLLAELSDGGAGNEPALRLRRRASERSPRKIIRGRHGA
jgi:signal transduction histidine kinase/ActR/RegA family two-component response regulator